MAVKNIIQAEWKKSIRTSPGILFLFLIFSLGGCQGLPQALLAPQEPKLVLTPVSFDAVSRWSMERHGEALSPFLDSCAKYAKTDKEKPFFGAANDSAKLFGTFSDWQEPCRAAAAVDKNDHVAARAFFEKWFHPYLATNNGEEEGLFTGYYEPELKGSRKRSSRYHVPLYGRPKNLVHVDLGRFREEWRGRRLAGKLLGTTLVPYETRADINGGALEEKAPELLYVDDPVGAFFLHVQGSGRILLEDGKSVRVAYAGVNGHEYVSIGAELIARGEISREDMSLQALRAWLEKHPDQAQRLLEKNPSYVFFKESPIKDAAKGPPGAQGVALTPLRSLAVDRAFLPLGIPLWLETSQPGNEAARDKPLSGLMIAQDTGGAIKGPVRGDIFFGFGPKAEASAGVMKSRGRYFLLLPRRANPAGGGP